MTPEEITERIRIECAYKGTSIAEKQLWNGGMVAATVVAVRLFGEVKPIEVPRRGLKKQEPVEE